MLLQLSVRSLKDCFAFLFMLYDMYTYAWHLCMDARKEGTYRTQLTGLIIVLDKA